MRAPVKGTLPGCPVRTTGTWMRRFSTAGLARGGVGYVTATAAPSGNTDPPSKTTTPLWTRPGMTMPSLFVARDREARGNPGAASLLRAARKSPDAGNQPLGRRHVRLVVLAEFLT